MSRILRACFKIPWGPVFAEKAVCRGACLPGGHRQATKENIPGGSSTEEHRDTAVSLRQWENVGRPRGRRRFGMKGAGWVGGAWPEVGALPGRGRQLIPG